ncbi:MAG: 4-alpha-glucanotransferase, partial [Candidatus Omnitrophica bacterium]|nr:4-alpha-glucanotransferase [Candidatus Omnitrophota bacterium]
MQYLARALKAMGLDVVIVEPRYLWGSSQDRDMDKKLDYESLPIPLKMNDEVDFTVGVTVQGSKEDVLVYKTDNDEDIPVITFRDKGNWYVQILYRNDNTNTEGNRGCDPASSHFIEFATKAFLAVVDKIEGLKRKEEGQEWKAPLLGLNDGQTVAAAAWSLFLPEFQTPVLLEAYYASTTHTVLNRQFTDREYLKRAGVPDEWMWLWKAKIVYGDQGYDWSSAGLRATMLRRGFTNYVSDSHGYQMRQFDPQIYESSGIGLTNGDLVWLTQRYFTMQFIESRFASQGLKDDYRQLKKKQQEEADKFKRAKLQQEMDKLAYKGMSSWVDDAARTDEELSVMFTELVRACKEHYIKTYIKPRVNQWNITLPNEYNGDWGAYFKDMEQMLWSGYSGRWVHEKWGRDGAFSDNNITEGIEQGQLFVILGNVQDYKGTEAPGGSKWEGERFLELAKRLNSFDSRGKLIYNSRFEIDEQIALLPCLALQMQDSSFLTQLRNPLITGAAESTEAHTWMHGGCAALHGYIQLIQALANRKACRGSNIVPKDSSEGSYLELYEWVLEAEKQGRLSEHLLDGFKLFRSVDVNLTAAEYARQWDKMVGKEKAKRQELIAKNPDKFIHQILLEEFGGFAQPEHEVAFAQDEKNYLQIKQRLDSGKVILDNEPCAGGNRVCVMSRNANELELVVPVRLSGLKRVSAWIETPEGVIEEFSQVEEKPDEDLVIFKKAVCANGKEKKFRVIITSGKWRQEHEVTLTPRLSSKVRQEICEQSNHKMKIRIIEEAGYVKQIEEKVWDVMMGHKVKIEITMPLRRYGVCSKLAPVILGTTNPVKNVNGERFIVEADIGDYLVENDSAKWTITFTPKRSGWLTAALFERLDMNNDSLRKEDIISWANGWGGDIHINVLATQEMRAKYLNQECASSPVEKHANSKVVSIHHKEIKRVRGELDLVEKRISETKSFLPDVQAWDKLFYKAELGWLLAQKRNLLRILKELTGKANPIKFKGSSSPVDAWWQIPNETYIVETMSIAALRRMNNDPGDGKWTDIAPYFKSRLLPNGIRVAVMLPHYPILLESPYGSICQYAVNADYNDWSGVPEVMGHKEEFGPLLTSPSREINHAELRYRESTILQKAFDIFQRECILNNSERAGQFKEFCARHDKDWLDDFADFIVLHLFFNGSPWWKWDGERVRQARIASHYLELKNRYKYSQWIGYQQLAQALRDVNALGGYLLFDDAMFRAKDSVDVYRHHQEFFRDIDTRYPGIVNENANERWMDLALWNWDALRKDGYKLKLDPIRHWLDFGFAGGRTDALHFSWNFGRGQLASGDEDGEDFAAALVKVYLEGGKFPLAEAYEGKAGDAERLGFVVIDGNAKRLSTHDDHSRWYHRNAVDFMVGFNNLLQAQVSPKSSRFIIYTMGDLWGDYELIKVVRITTSWGETIYVTGLDRYDRSLKLKPEEIVLRDSLWRYRIPIPSDPDYRLRSRYDLGPFIKFMTRVYPRLQKEGKGIWEDEEAIACIMPTLYAAADSFVKSFNGVPQIWAASRDWFFEQWGRDTFISYTGCLLLQKWLHPEAKALLESFSRLERAGLIPNRIIDPLNPEYNTVDGSMWFVYIMTHKYLDYTGDTETIKRMLPVIRRVMLGYYNGTGYYDRNGQWQGIYADKEDGLIISPAQSTWMDAVPEQTAPVTPRNGKCVEIQGLWYANLRWLAEATEKFNLQPENNEPDWKKLAETVKNNFRSKFWNSNLKNPGESDERENCLFDVIGPDGTPYSAQHGAALRPNQLIALSVAPDLLPIEAQALVLNACQNDLNTPYGPRTLSPRDSNYHPHYDTYCQPRPDSSDFSKHKDFAYHQGTSWPWLIGPEIDLLVRVKRWQGVTEAKIKEEVRFRTEKLLLRLFTHGSIDEVFNGGEPGSAASQYPGGTSSQAWSVAELLRILYEYRVCEGGISKKTVSSPVFFSTEKKTVSPSPDGIKAIIFDFDGVIADTIPVCRAALRQIIYKMFKEAGFEPKDILWLEPWINEFFKRILGTPTRETLPEIAGLIRQRGKTEAKPAMEYVEDYEELRDRQLKNIIGTRAASLLTPGAKEAIEGLSQILPLYIISAGGYEKRNILIKLGLNKYFNETKFLLKRQNGKSDTIKAKIGEMSRIIMANGFLEEEVLIVDDAPKVIVALRKAIKGAHLAMFAAAEEKEGKLEKARALFDGAEPFDFVVENLGELKNRLPNSDSSLSSSPCVNKLNDREVSILVLLVLGKSNAGICKELNIGIGSLKRLLASITAKLGVDKKRGQIAPLIIAAYKDSERYFERFPHYLHLNRVKEYVYKASKRGAEWLTEMELTTLGIIAEDILNGRPLKEAGKEMGSKPVLRNRLYWVTKKLGTSRNYGKLLPIFIEVYKQEYELVNNQGRIIGRDRLAEVVYILQRNESVARQPAQEEAGKVKESNPLLKTQIKLLETAIKAGLENKRISYKDIAAILGQSFITVRERVGEIRSILDIPKFLEPRYQTLVQCVISAAEKGYIEYDAEELKKFKFMFERKKLSLKLKQALLIQALVADRDMACRLLKIKEGADSIRRYNLFICGAMGIDKKGKNISEIIMFALKNGEISEKDIINTAMELEGDLRLSGIQYAIDKGYLPGVKYLFVQFKENIKSLSGEEMDLLSWIKPGSPDLRLEKSIFVKLNVEKALDLEEVRLLYGVYVNLYGQGDNNRPGREENGNGKKRMGRKPFERKWEARYSDFRSLPDLRDRNSANYNNENGSGISSMYDGYRWPTREEEGVLGRECLNGNAAAREILAIIGIKIIIFRIQKIIRSQYKGYLDLYGRLLENIFYTNRAILDFSNMRDVVALYDPDKGFRLSTLLYNWFPDESIKKLIADEIEAIRIEGLPIDTPVGDDNDGLRLLDMFTDNKTENPLERLEKKEIIAYIIGRYKEYKVRDISKAEDLFLAVLSILMGQHSGKANEIKKALKDEGFARWDIGREGIRQRIERGKLILARILKEKGIVMPRWKDDSDFALPSVAGGEQKLLSGGAFS